LRWIAADAAGVRAAAANAGGHATLFRAAQKATHVFQPLAPASLAAHKRLKAVFDPRGVLNPGRLYRDF
jgi:glycolate oxidase FAD binding subunit